jgi:hypothetical protein
VKIVSTRDYLLIRSDPTDEASPWWPEWRVELIDSHDTKNNH